MIDSSRAAFWRILLFFSFANFFVVACSTEEPVASKYKRGQPGGSSVTPGPGNAPVNNPGIDNLGGSDDLAEESDDNAEEEPDTAPGTPSASPPPAADPAQVQAQLVQQGTQLYNQRCALCHGAFDATLKPNRTADTIVMAANNPNHLNVTWPNRQEAEALQAALAR